MLSLPVAIHASGAETATGETAIVDTLGGIESGGADSAVFYLNLTASTAPTTLDIDITATIGGVDWVLGSFTQLGAVATGAEKITIANCPKNVKAEFAIAGTSYTFSIYCTR